jgi:hypothetical protein
VLPKGHDGQTIAFSISLQTPSPQAFLVELVDELDDVLRQSCSHIA